VEVFYLKAFIDDSKDSQVFLSMTVILDDETIPKWDRYLILMNLWIWTRVLGAILDYPNS
jgi:hypothetical protein